MSASKEVTVKINVDGKQAVAGIGGIIDRVKSLSSGFSGIGGAAAVVAGAIAAVAKSARDHLQEVAKISKSLDTSLQDAERISYAATATGTDVSAMFGKIGEARSKALLGGAEEQTAFARIGISFTDLKEKSPADLFWAIAKAAESGQINSTTFSAAVRILGESARDAIPSLKNLSSAAADFDASGLGSSEATLRGGVGVLKSWNRMKGQASGVGGALATRVAAPIAGGILDLMTLLGSSEMTGAAGLGSKVTSGRLKAWFERMADRAVAPGGEVLAGYLDGGSAAQTDAMARKLRQKEAIRDIERRQEEAAYINGVWESMQGTGSPEHASAVDGMRIPSMRAQADTMARIGGFSGGGDRPNAFQQQHLSLMRTQIEELRSVYRALNTAGDASGFSLPSSFPTPGSSW